jgi:small-conductance mechanosensitive channel
LVEKTLDDLPPKSCIINVGTKVDKSSRSMDMERAETLRRLRSYPAQIEAQRTVVDGSAASLRTARAELEEREDYYTLAETEDGSPKYLNGKNADARAAQLRQLTMVERKRVREVEEQKATAERILNRLLDDFSAAKYAARLLAGSDEG